MKLRKKPFLQTWKRYFREKIYNLEFKQCRNSSWRNYKMWSKDAGKNIYKEKRKHWYAGGHRIIITTKSLATAVVASRRVKISGHRRSCRGRGWAGGPDCQSVAQAAGLRPSLSSPAQPSKILQLNSMKPSVNQQ